ncbi:protein NRT1/ PTR FAMILY 5.10 isoform X1 [Cucumis sativus]|uniref:protein NRT1/ PTR FAMILY 5.10 isoform X1 n=1 Tax=Cucumis sativus TaxID=3659 RepID=UPI0012F4953A|nr:protein NRT1/ PTR FAMILY 5.10 isoform X1 [Cucumis sativus]XP_011654840.2 protein NRT1/ PTR FAMILY 5.10 isoform X1 [Cucumis sativus]XP_031741608.1 protein NRT1/ PTR FAMILY 5.10 isoform X1 [Cucumis sativus]
MEAPLLDETVEGAVDYKGNPASRFNSGGWRSASIIIGVEIAERFALFGTSSNLINFLTDQLQQSTATAAKNVNAWSGTAALLPLLGAFLADCVLGQYRTIVLFTALYVLGLGLLALSAALPSLGISACQQTEKFLPCSPNLVQVILFFFSLYLVAFGKGGHEPCIQAFGADQFDEQHPEERKAKSSFFNWWYLGISFGTLSTLNIMSYVQENLSWSLGFGIPCIAMAFGFAVFLLGTRTYRFSNRGVEENPSVRIGRVFITAIKNWQVNSSEIAHEEETHGLLLHHNSKQLRFLDKALIVPNSLKEESQACSINDVEEAKAVLRLIPIWVTCLAFAIVLSQISTFFTKQGVTMDRSIVVGFEVPAASLQSFMSLTVIISLLIYDRTLIPTARKFTGKPSGITMLQRIGFGMLLSIICMVVAALVEVKRLKTAQEYGLVDLPKATIPLSIWWLVPQYVIFGVASTFTTVGLQEFFYDQIPSGLGSIGVSLYLSVFGIGSFLSSFLISAIEKLTSGDGKQSWFDNNLNKAHLDYFYWLLAGLSVVGLIAFLCLARTYIYTKGNTT